MQDLDSFIKELLDRKKVDSYILEISERVTSESALKELLLLARETDQFAQVLSTQNVKQVEISCGEILTKVFLASKKDYLHNPGRRFIKALSIEASRRIQQAGNRLAVEAEFSEPKKPYDGIRNWSFHGDSQDIYRCPSCMSIKISKDDLGGNCPQCFKKLPLDLTPSYRSKENAFGRKETRSKQEGTDDKKITDRNTKILKCSLCGSKRTRRDNLSTSGRLVCANCGSKDLQYYQRLEPVRKPVGAVYKGPSLELPTGDRIKLSRTNLLRGVLFSIIIWGSAQVLVDSNRTWRSPIGWGSSKAKNKLSSHSTQPAPPRLTKGSPAWMEQQANHDGKWTDGYRYRFIDLSRCDANEVIIDSRISEENARLIEQLKAKKELYLAARKYLERFKTDVSNSTSLATRSAEWESALKNKTLDIIKKEGYLENIRPGNVFELIVDITGLIKNIDSEIQQNNSLARTYSSEHLFEHTMGFDYACTTGFVEHKSPRGTFVCEISKITWSGKKERIIFNPKSFRLCEKQ